MTKFFKLAAVVLLITAVVFCLAGCKDDPKALAKETYEIAKETAGALFNSSKAEELKKRAAAVSKKVEKLSASDKSIFNSELLRLAGDNLGGLLDLGGSILNSSQELLDFSKQLNDTVKQAKDTFDSAAKQAGELLDLFR